MLHYTVINVVKPPCFFAFCVREKNRSQTNLGTQLKLYTEMFGQFKEMC